VSQELHCPEVENVGVYVLGALDADEREGFEAHLETCEECRLQFDGLAHLPALLDLAGPPSAMPTPAHGPFAPAGGEERLVTSLQRASRRRRRRTALIAAGTGLAGAAAAAALILGLGVGGDDTPAPVISLAPASTTVGADAWATAKLHDRAAGSIVDFEAGGLPWSKSGDRYVVLVRENGKTVAQATFTVDADGWAQVAMTSGQKIYPDAQLEVRKDTPGQPVVLRSNV
jgi:putative zinc finger protein